MAARKEDTNPSLADLIAKNDLAGIEKMITDAADGAGDPELVARIQQLEANLEAEREHRQRLNPMAEWPVYETVDDLIGHLGEDRLMEAAMEEIRA